MLRYDLIQSAWPRSQSTWQPTWLLGVREQWPMGAQFQVPPRETAVPQQNEERHAQGAATCILFTTVPTKWNQTVQEKAWTGHQAGQKPLAGWSAHPLEATDVGGALSLAFFPRVLAVPARAGTARTGLGLHGLGGSSRCPLRQPAAHPVASLSCAVPPMTNVSDCRAFSGEGGGGSRRGAAAAGMAPAPG